ncbi:hypothetical protein Dimus_030971, partial [Dionaea muscipula]
MNASLLSCEWAAYWAIYLALLMLHRLNCSCPYSFLRENVALLHEERLQGRLHEIATNRCLWLHLVLSEPLRWLLLGAHLACEVLATMLADSNTDGLILLHGPLAS